jgi:starvation-inducible DNA-binding protein
MLTPLTTPDTEKICEELNHLMAYLIDLSLMLRLCHWNLQGVNFSPVRMQFISVSRSLDDGIGSVSERITTLGVPAEGDAEKVKSTSRLERLPGGFMTPSVAAELVSSRVLEVTRVLREANAVIWPIDNVTGTMLIGITAGLERHMWLIQSEVAPDGNDSPR